MSSSVLPTDKQGLREQLRYLSEFKTRNRTGLYAQTDVYRAKIKTAAIIRRLYAHFQDANKTPLTVTQLAAARILLAKVLPDLSARQENVTDDRPARELTDRQLMRIVEKGMGDLEIEGEVVSNDTTDSSS